jgi:acetyl-CoA carboxylase carboxyl transferase subunit alpha
MCSQVCCGYFEEIDQLAKSQQLTKSTAILTPWQITKIARHPERYTRWTTFAGYSLTLSSFTVTFFRRPQHRRWARSFRGTACMVIGQQKAVTPKKTRGLRNFSMNKPEGYRKVHGS